MEGTAVTQLYRDGLLQVHAAVLAAGNDDVLYEILQEARIFCLQGIHALLQVKGVQSEKIPVKTLQAEVHPDTRYIGGGRMAAAQQEHQGKGGKDQ
jgi:hypothetical protein